MFGMIFVLIERKNNRLILLFGGVSGCRHTPFFRHLRAYGDYLKSKAEQAAKVLDEI